MAIVNEYKGSYPSEVNNFETDSFYVNATSMEKAVSMLTLEHGKEPTICTKIIFLCSSFRVLSIIGNSTKSF